MNLPNPSQEALIHQNKLLDHIALRCDQAGGYIPFADFMDLALYAPGLGYYSAGMHTFGKQGDFVTAPEISPLFSQCLGAQCEQVLSALSCEQSHILELGAGSGRMAAEIMQFLAQQHCLPVSYQILEVSADLKQRQQNYLREHCTEFFERFVWLDRLPNKPFKGMILGNEVIDAMPVHLFQITENGQILEGQVGKDWRLSYRESLTSSLFDAINSLQARLDSPLAPGYTSEIQLSLAAWIASLSACLEQGIMLFIDYGFPSREYYHPDRTMGTLMCHYRHYAHSDPMLYIGLQDITSHVDFTALALGAQACQLDLAGFTHQAAFLLGNGLLNLTLEGYGSSQQIQQLTAPHEMGELFKAIAFSKGFSEPLQGFQFLDQRHRL